MKLYDGSSVFTAAHFYIPDGAGRAMQMAVK
jgi:hypothetical protein